MTHNHNHNTTSNFNGATRAEQSSWDHPISPYYCHTRSYPPLRTVVTDEYTGACKEHPVVILIGGWIGSAISKVRWNDNTNIRPQQKYQHDIPSVWHFLSYATACGTGNPSPLPLLIGGRGNGHGGLGGGGISGLVHFQYLFLNYSHFHSLFCAHFTSVSGENLIWSAAMAGWTASNRPWLGCLACFVNRLRHLGTHQIVLE